MLIFIPCSLFQRAQACAAICTATHGRRAWEQRPSSAELVTGLIQQVELLTPRSLLLAQGGVQRLQPRHQRGEARPLVRHRAPAVADELGELGRRVRRDVRPQAAHHHRQRGLDAVQARVRHLARRALPQHDREAARARTRAARRQQCACACCMRAPACMPKIAASLLVICSSAQTPALRLVRSTVPAAAYRGCEPFGEAVSGGGQGPAPRAAHDKTLAFGAGAQAPRGAAQLPGAAQWGGKSAWRGRSAGRQVGLGFGQESI